MKYHKTKPMSKNMMITYNPPLIYFLHLKYVFLIEWFFTIKIYIWDIDFLIPELIWMKIEKNILSS